MKIIDTDVFVDALRGIEKAEAWLQKIIQVSGGSFCSITESELLSGKACDDPEKRESLLHFLSLFTKIPVDNPVAQIAGDFRRKYNISLPDAIIAASAFHTGSPVITRNARDFSKIREIRIEMPY